MHPQQILEQLLSDYNQANYAELAVITAIQRAAAMVHQANHWRTRGPLFYSDHLLFDRVYSTVNEMVDGLAEKAIGMGSYQLMDPVTQLHQIDALVEHFCSTSSTDTPAEQYPHISLDVEQLCISLISRAKDSLEAKGLLTNGIDNLLQGLLDTHENLVYLLKQRLGQQA